MKKFSLKKTFRACAAVAALALTAPFAGAAAPAKPFVPHSPTGESCPAPDASRQTTWKTPDFDASPREQQTHLAAIGLQIGRNKPDGQFNERATASVNEFRLLTNDEGYRESMTAKNLSDLKTFAASVKAAQTAHKLDLETATALKFASERTGVSMAALVAAHKKGFAPDAGEWLYLVDTHGGDYGLDFFTDRIEKKEEDGALRYAVKDPFVFEQILALQDHPRIFAMMMAESIKAKRKAETFAPLAKAEPLPEHAPLEILGFDLGDEADSRVRGPMTEAALMKFDRLYAPAAPFFGAIAVDPAQAQLARLKMFAEQAQKDAAAYGISAPAAAAIRLANIRTGADFGYMMELSSAESGFDPSAQARTSSATGLYQFTEDTWLHAIKRYGAKYGLGDLAAQIDATENMYGTLVARVYNPFVRATLLDLRRDPHLAALLSAEFQMRNKFLIECSVGHELNRTEQYLGHFLGSRGGAHFINKMKENPNLSAAKIFPTAAAANKPIFYSKNSQGKSVARTLRQVYNILDRKFETEKFEDHGEKVSQPAKPPESPRP